MIRHLFHRASGWAVGFACALALGTYPARAADWPTFLGPEGNNVSGETNLLTRWPEGGPRVLWDQALGSGYGAPSVRAGILVVHHRKGEEEIVEACDASTGKPLWHHASLSTFSDPYGYNNGPRATPLLTSNFCYTFGAGGRLLCLDLHSGRLVWERETTKEWQVPRAFFGAGTSPILEAGKLIVMVGGQPDSTLVAFDPATGRTLWESVGQKTWSGVPAMGWGAGAPYEWTGEEQLASYSTPFAVTMDGRRHLLALTRQGLVSVDPADGAVRFRRWFQSPVSESVNAMRPVVSGNEVLISAAYYRIGAVLIQSGGDGHSFKESWRSPERKSGAAADAPNLEIHWSTPVLVDGFVYAFSGRNEPDASFRCVEWRTGKVVWTRDERWRPHSTPQPPVYGRGSLILADGKLIVLGEGGKLGLFAPDPHEPKELCSWQVPQLHYPCWAAPVLADRRLYLRNEDRLVCLDLAGN